MNRKRLLVLFLVTIMLASVSMLSPKTVYACSCAEAPSVLEARDRNDSVFEGQVVKVTNPVAIFSRSSADKKTVEFQVNEVWKGKVAPTIKVTTASSGASCGYDFVEGERYLVFANQTGSTLDAGLCNGTLQYSASGSHLQELGSGSVPIVHSNMEQGKDKYDWRIVGSGLLLVVMLIGLFFAYKAKKST